MARLRHSLFLVMSVDRFWYILHLAFVQTVGQYGLLGLPGPSFEFPGDRARQNMQNTGDKTILSCKHFQWLDCSAISWGGDYDPRLRPEGTCRGRIIKRTL